CARGSAPRGWVAIRVAYFDYW
nr:immunoglobulin heavy chain junction region [Macaca mulatta]